MARAFFVLLVSIAATDLSVAEAKDDQLQHVMTTMRCAAGYFDQHVSSHGGYLWRYSSDLSTGEGENSATKDTVWVQPPGTPSVGQVLLDAYKATEDKFYLDAAVRTGQCLVRGQLRSGGWDYRIEFGPQLRQQHAYRVESESKGTRNTTTLDDNTTQAALRFLMQLDQTLKFENAAIHDSTLYGLRALLAAQYPNGAWPQRFDTAIHAEDYPVKKAGYPDAWSRTYPGKDYRGYYTFNDNALADVIDVMFLAGKIYGEPAYRQSAVHAGEFILLAQMPDPQPAWAQQYNMDMQPAWARKFEPPAVTGGESQGILLTLLQLYRETGERRFLEPIPRALEYLGRSRLDGGELARFYELRTNRPLYFTREYELTYSDQDLPAHYGFKIRCKVDRIQSDFERLASLSPQRLAELRRDSKRPEMSRSLERSARSVIVELDELGRWTESGHLLTQPSGSDTTTVIESRTFIGNMQVLIDYILAARAARQ